MKQILNLKNSNMVLDINSKTILLSLDNIEIFRKVYNDMMKILFGVDDWIKYYEEWNKCQLEDFIGKTCGDVKDMLSYIDRDSLFDDYIFS